jgi:hypothetical protein
MDTLHKNRAGLGQMSLDDLPGPELYAVELERHGGAEHSEDTDGTDRIRVNPGRELVEVSRQGARCYRLEKIKCGKKGCRCTRGELHGPYWYAYYRENGRMRCEYMGKSLPEHVNLENRARKACKRSEAERKRAAKMVLGVKETLAKLSRFDTIPKLRESL